MATKKRILVVEDHAEIRRLLVFFLKQMGYDVIEAATGMAALAAARATFPDLITMDLGLPDVRGDEVTARLKTDPATEHIPVIVITAYYGDAELLESAAAAGACEILYKPVSLRILEDSLRRYLWATPREELLQQNKSH
jgi:CheY-like chemotaxis protein